MTEGAGEDDDESWAQTLITITPEENATIRTITDTTVISAVGDTPLELDVNQISDRRIIQSNTIRGEFLIDNAELEETRTQNDAECQTFLQGVPKVELPSGLKDEATQTMYLGKICPHTANPFQDITRIMNDRKMPVEGKATEITQTIIWFEPDALRNDIVDRLTNGITAEELDKNDIIDETTSAGSIYVMDNLHFILERVLWQSDPDYSVPQVELKDEVAQTCIKYDHGLRKVVLDADTQTSLTCEPKRSNTDLLSEWSAMKQLARDIIEECLETGVYPRIIVHSILDEVIARCKKLFHLEGRDEISQTLAPCNALQDKDEEVLRKLRLELVLDPLESSIIVLPLVGILVEKTCLEIRENAPIVATEILNRIQRKSATIATRLAAIRQEAVSHKSIDDIFDARKKRLRELLQNKTIATVCASTQTELAGVPEIKKVKEPKETVCSTCVRHSDCYICEASFNDEEEDEKNAKRKDIVHDKILRTQDILIAYNPCYVVATPSKIPKIQPPITPRRLPVTKQSRPAPIKPDSGSLGLIVNRTSRKPKSEQRLFAEEVCPQVSKFRKLKGEDQAARSSLNDWAKVVQESSSISGAWSIHGSSSAESNKILKQIGVSSNCQSRKPVRKTKECVRSVCDLSSRSVKALNILKKTFNLSEDTCSDCSYDQESLDIKRIKEKEEEDVTICSKNIIEEDNNGQQTSGYNENPCGEGMRVVPVIYLPNQVNKKY